eukprot:gnl/MRDRNA2_/MRDRNA2_73178_c0_seq2.p1 gnl/MRDRNA2_/MRDRNA2_73178_c0~~gnl/MRDRNA2_/MRDRNA2_73178_c0_seq2.p1  ORF type:complete len:128 (+),score=8.04 gnl/MRDRNA2_/MRDRNA2_73178_c0_seq2:137-520(+)
MLASFCALNSDAHCSAALANVVNNSFSDVPILLWVAPYAMLASYDAATSPDLVACIECWTSGLSTSELVCSQRCPWDSFANRPSEFQQADKWIPFNSLSNSRYVSRIAVAEGACLIIVVISAGLCKS